MCNFCQNCIPPTGGLDCTTKGGSLGGMAFDETPGKLDNEYYKQLMEIAGRSNLQPKAANFCSRRQANFMIIKKGSLYDSCKFYLPGR